MFIVLYEFKVDEGKQQEYIAVTRQQIKPFWEAKGCGYSLYRSREEPERFIKVMSFPDEPALRKAVFEKDDKTEKIVNLFKNFARDVKRSIYETIV
ncbi:MAG: antibiotic biosynthesis monooxygenase [Candidatus Bathyarchaeia archaeon]